MKPLYPSTRRDDQVETIHGMTVPDPFRWLEDDHSPETEAWISAQNEFTRAYLQDIPIDNQFTQRITELWNFEKFGVPFRKGGRIFFTRNDGLQNQASLYWLDNLEGEPHLLLDPNILTTDGTVALSGTAVSGDGQYLAYSLS
jgi:prolyl oligopeptidase